MNPKPVAKIVYQGWLSGTVVFGCVLSADTEIDEIFVKALHPEVSVITSLPVFVNLIAAAAQKMPAESLQGAFIDVRQHTAPMLHKPAEMRSSMQRAYHHRWRVPLLLQCSCESVNEWPAEAGA
jgi:hypothetical protein